MESILLLAPTLISNILSGPGPTYSSLNNTSTIIDKPTEFNRPYIKTEAVPDGTKCYVDSHAVEALKKLGWKIVKEKDENKYFYYSSKETPKISSIFLNNSYVDELRNKLVVAENTAITYQAFNMNPSPYIMNNYVLGYLRSFNINYSGLDSVSNVLEWNIVAGGLPPIPYTEIVDSIQSCKDYFSSYVNSNEYNAALHGKRSSQLDSKAIEFKDPVLGWKNIDLLHLFAAIDGCYDFTNTYNIPATEMFPLATYPQYTHDLVSWAGDLHQAANYIQDNTEKFNLDSNNFDTIMSKPEAGCSYPDIIADMDAVNITDSILIGPGRISDAIGEYYPQIFSNGYRATKFIYGVLSDKNKEWNGNVYEQFEQEVYDDLGLEKAGNSWIDSDEYKNSTDILKHPINTSRFKLLRKSNPSAKVREFVARSFVNYVLDLC